MTRDVINQLQDKILAREGLSEDFKRGVTAMALAVLNVVGAEENVGKGDLMNPHRGMRVRCRDRAIVLQVVEVREFSDGTNTRRVLDVIIIPDGRERHRGRHFEEEGPARQHMKLSTWRRWVKGGRILPPASEREPGVVDPETTTDPGTQALGEIAALFDMSRDEWHGREDELIRKIKALTKAG